MPEENVLHIFLRSIIVYFVTLFGMRLSGKRDVGQMTPFDLVLLLLIANAVQNAMTGDDYSLTGGLVAGVSLLLVNFVVSRIAWRSKKIRRLIEGEPTVLVYKGKVHQKNMDREKVTQDELEQALREHNTAHVQDVGLAMLEIDGSISILKKKDMGKGA